MSEAHTPPREKDYRLIVLFSCLELVEGFEWGENCLQFPERVNSGHPLFIGEGRTGAKSLFLRHGKPKPKYWFRFFVCVWRGIWAIAIVVKRRYIRSEQTLVCVFADRRKNSPVDYFAGTGATEPQIPLSPLSSTAKSDSIWTIKKSLFLLL